ncbi:exonuclease SbcCD subunit D C-terminal domain-containing protein [Amnibacterium sp. CER49]|uniref:exonuclease SbcCD subunit D n=1 Tax=Amnibacterium sp. CER49 TaxID=3039161 RepID=UPI0024498514|nr:exonuclease SbcCD subunit D [Amnibacterium sp. CER49]MDH2444608.1 exonuclease SbcCD subunit D C-terminal domain-containing protein [Amnibacterium sp. CER49]
MRLLHTSDWHIGRTFHTHSTLEHLGAVLGALVTAVREQSIDVVLVAGDVFDSAAPSTAAIELFQSALQGVRHAGAQVVLTSGNHDSVTRLGLHAEWLGAAGIHLRTRWQRLDEPVVLGDDDGEVLVYGVPYLEPSLLKHEHPDRRLASHEDALRFAMDRVRADAAARGGRSVVLAHCFAAGVPAGDVERDISRGGLDLVPASVFDGVDYVALGHIHGRAVLSDTVRYSGALLHYSFGEAGKPRGGWVIDLGADGVRSVDWLELPVPRALRVLEGPLERLLGDPALDAAADCWVKAVVTDRVRPTDGMRLLQRRFPHCVAFEWRPEQVDDGGTATYAERVRGRTDTEIVADFLALMRGGEGPSEFEQRLVTDLLAAGEGAA